MRLCTLALLAAAVLMPVQATWLNNPDNNYEFRSGVELGFFGFFSNRIQFGRGDSGTQFDYVEDGKANILFPFRRLSAELHLKPRHTFDFLIQPIDVRTQATLRQMLVLDGDTFPAGTPMNLRYGFDYYRISWQYDLLPDPDRELAFGVSLQLRDAAIVFSSQDGTMSRSYTDVGPVPILRVRTRFPLTGSSWLGFEADGFYAQGKVITGSSNVESTFKGAILDASARYGMAFNDWLDGFLNLRYLGGGASGGQLDPENPDSGGYTDNWLGAFSVGLGFYIK
jgi:hypothetical protein